MPPKPEKILKDYFGYSSFRPLQKDIIRHSLNGCDVLAVMPTGGGKSLCYQLPALLRPGITIVVSPLISLMKDQVEQLREAGIHAVFLNSALSRPAYRKNIALITNGRVKLVYVSPETLLSEWTLNVLQSVPVSCLTVDEAHCISEWGHDFRPEYRNISQVRSLFPDCCCLALTATATPKVQQDIISSLRLRSPKTFIAGFNRENLYIQIVPKDDPLRQVTSFVRKYNGESGIIYCFSKKQVDDLSLYLDDKGFSVKPYHAGLPAEIRDRNQELFLRDEIKIMVATIAFGMGINKPNVRFVLHHDLPKNIESYYQQIGRAGRNGLQAHCLLLYSYTDRRKIEYFISRMKPREQKTARRHLAGMTALAETTKCRRQPLLSYFGEKPAKKKCGSCDNCTGTAAGEADITIPAMMFLSCVKRTGEQFGQTHIINVLRGSGSQKLKKFGHDTLSVYGIGRHFSKSQWQHLCRQLLCRDLLLREEQFQSLKITAKGNDVLYKKAPVFGTMNDSGNAVLRVETADIEYDEDLFQLLRKKRQELAKTAGIPPYVIFPDVSLIQMSAFLPQTEQDMLRIEGIGETRLQRYGEQFLALIREQTGRR